MINANTGFDSSGHSVMLKLTISMYIIGTPKEVQRSVRSLLVYSSDESLRHVEIHRYHFIRRFEAPAESHQNSRSQETAQSLVLMRLDALAVVTFIAIGILPEASPNGRR
jgi:hypothetical protein